ncbi:RNA methyltransferase PUA domain-containing protein, partial [Arthrospira platensis SPKY1]|nr:RNA methyltransferase PUA domain-containing protein [Arthrospira platensis SPKY1]
MKGRNSLRASRFTLHSVPYICPMRIFYTTHILGNEAFLEAEEARHCTQVLRMREGEELALVDGKGGFYQGVLSAVGKRECRVTITSEEQDFGKRPFLVHLAVAPTKN